jgi:hypothetical protein
MWTCLSANGREGRKKKKEELIASKQICSGSEKAHRSPFRFCEADYFGSSLNQWRSNHS